MRNVLWDFCHFMLLLFLCSCLFGLLFFYVPKISLSIKLKQSEAPTSIITSQNKQRRPNGDSINSLNKNNKSDG